MTIREGRPSAREIRIEDCSSVKVFDNSAPRCPHNKNWRESDYADQPSGIQDLMCPRDECEAIEYHPHTDKHILITVPRSFKDRQPLSDLFSEAVGAGFSQVTVDSFGRRVTVADKLEAIIRAAVIDWGWTDKEGKVLPTPDEDWDSVASILEQSELWWIVRAMLAGGDPEIVRAQQGN